MSQQIDNPKVMVEVEVIGEKQIPNGLVNLVNIRLTFKQGLVSFRGAWKIWCAQDFEQDIPVSSIPVA